jgi:phosphatidate cytidylyltransferase
VASRIRPSPDDDGFSRRGPIVTRVISAAILLPILFGTVWFLPPVGTLVLAELAAGLAFVEYCALAAALGANVPRVLSGAAVLAACAAVGTASGATDIVLLSAVVAIGALAVQSAQPGPGILRDAAASLFPALYIGLPLGALAAVRLVGRDAVALLAIGIIVSDSGQYYSGRLFGRRLLAPSISPKKTVEGAIGGVVLGGAAMVVGGLRVFPAASLPILLLMSAAVVAVGIVGDLFESLLKRSAGVKDSSALIPGHGGVLDRIDSWLFAGPVYYVFVRYLQI